MSVTFFCVEVRDIECREVVTFIEHGIHVRHILCVEVRDIECREVVTFIEHGIHVCHILLCRS